MPSRSQRARQPSQRLLAVAEAKQAAAAKPPPAKAGSKTLPKAGKPRLKPLVLLAKRARFLLGSGLLLLPRLLHLSHLLLHQALLLQQKLPLGRLLGELLVLVPELLVVGLPLELQLLLRCDELRADDAARWVVVGLALPIMVVSKRAKRRGTWRCSILCAPRGLSELRHRERVGCHGLAEELVVWISGDFPAGLRTRRCRRQSWSIARPERRAQHRAPPGSF